MRFDRVCLESFGYCLPQDAVTSARIEERLSPLYQRLRLPEGRLELMTGIGQRRFWPPGTLPSEKSIESANLAIEAAEIDRGDIGALVHASVCRDYLEPATACSVHHALGLPGRCLVYDVSNACLGLLNGALQIANMIQLGQIRAGVVVGTEDSRHLVDTTIEQLNADLSITRDQVKRAVASMTIGSGSCAMLLVDRELTRTDNRLLAVEVRADTQHHALCHSGRDEAVAGGMQPWMETDSETLMHEGIATGVSTFEKFLRQADWTRDEIDKSICHQVGAVHRKLMLDAMGLNPDVDFTTVQWLGNTGSVALPITLAIACQQSFIHPQDRVVLLGIGSGINCIMMAAHWNKSLVGAQPSETSAAGLMTSARSK